MAFRLNFGAKNRQKRLTIFSQKSAPANQSSKQQREREIVRETKAVEIHIRYTSPSGEIYLLSEEKQTFRDGRERRRNYPWSVSGKIKAHETSEQAFKRELDEELPSIRGNFKSMVEHPEPKIVIRKSNSYPGLISHFTVFVFEVELTNEQFQTSGYISVEPELTNHFVWKKINETNPNK